MQQLAEALELRAEERGALGAAARGRAEGHPGGAGAALEEQAAPNSPTNLPDEPTSFIGREREIEEVAGLLQTLHIRMVTLTGPGGIGKTRLALQVGNTLLHDFRDGVFFVNLAPLGESVLVPSAIAEVLTVQEEAGKDLVETLTASLKGKHLLLVLDNCEHLLEASLVVGTLLEQCRELHILVTSRIPLHLSREHEYPVAPLSLPDPRHLPDPAHLSRYEAVALFIERARAIKPGFQVTKENVLAVVEVCYRLDGLPLAIELAAARLKMFPPQALLTRLQHRLPLLTGGAKDVPARQQTLRATIDWSYSLLSEDEQTLFAQLSVFAGGCTFEAAEAICHFDGNLDLLERLASLVDKSLVRQEGREGPRFVMLETIREYAQERMGLGGVSRELKWQHAHYYLHLAEASSLELPGPGQTVRLERLEAEHDNLRAALQWARDTGDVELGLRLAVALGRFWQMRGPLSEGQRWLDVFLAVDAGAPRVLRAEALFVAGQLVASRRHGGEAAELFERSLALYRELGDKPARTEAVSALALELLQRRDLDRAAALLEEGVALARELEDKALLEMSLRYLGVVVAGQGDAERARDLRDQSLNVYRELEVGRRAATLLRPGVGAPQARGGVPRIHAAVNRYLWVWFGETFIADPAFNRALGARIRGDYGEAVQLLGELLAQALDVGDRRYAAYARMFLGLLARDQGDYERAKALYTESLATFRNVDDDFGTAMALIGLSDVARDQGQAERVIELAEEGLGLMSKVGDTLFTGFCLHNLASAARYRGDYERAESLFAESLALLGDPGGSRSPAAEVLSSLGLLALERGDYQRAEEAFTEGLRAAREVGAHYVLGTLLEGMAGVAIGRGLAERAARLLGAAQAVRSALGTPIWPANRGLVEAQVAATRSALAADRYSDAWEEGQTMAAEEAIGFALTDTTLP